MHDRQRRGVSVRARCLARDRRVVGRAGRRLDALEPGLAEVRIDLARAEPATGAALAAADAALEDDGVALDVDQPAARLVDDVVDPRLDAQRLPAVAEHLAVE